MNDFFAHQEEARRRSVRLIILFGLAVIAVSLAVYTLAAIGYAWQSGRGAHAPGFWHPRLFLWTTGGTLLFISIGSLWKMAALREGGGAVARILGGRPVPLQTGDPRERQLRNVVEEMSIASGIPAPDLYVLDKERGINAFAAGHRTEDAAVCVTRGALELLDRDELQGVVAHEFSHILNGDMGINIRLLGWLNGILLLSLAGKAVLRGIGRTRGRGGGIIVLAAVALYVVGYVGYFFGLLIKSALSRQREYLGDASAVQFTRNPGGLAGALKKIGGLASGSVLAHPRADELSHLYFGNGLEESWLHAFDTHPPLAARILRLDPGFNGAYPDVTPLPAPPPSGINLSPQTPRKPPEQVSALSGAAVVGLLEQIGEPAREHVERAKRLMAELPEQLLEAARNPFGACALVYALLLDRDPETRRRQEEMLDSRADPSVAAEARALLPAVASLPPESFLPVLDLSLPSLRALSREQFLNLKETVAHLSAADNRTSLFEFTLRYLLMRRLEPHFNPHPRRPTQIYALRGVQTQCSVVLTAMARVGQRDETAAQKAFARGALVLNEPKTEISFVAAGDCGPTPLERALWLLDGASPPIKRKLLAACLECLIHDGMITPQEIELFRAVADAMGCPVPPWLITDNTGTGEPLDARS